MRRFWAAVLIIALACSWNTHGVARADDNEKTTAHANTWTWIGIGIGAGALLYALLHKHHAPSPSPSPTPERTPRPTTDETPDPSICTTWLTGGAFEPTQGVYQDDTTFYDKPVPYQGEDLVENDGSITPTFHAGVDMVLDRDTAIVGVDHFQRGGGWVSPHARHDVYLEGKSTCSRYVRMQLVLRVQQPSGYVDEYPGDGGGFVPYLPPALPNGEVNTWSIEVPVWRGLAQPPHLYFDRTGKYTLSLTLWRNDGSTLIPIRTPFHVDVIGRVIKTHFPTVHFVTPLLRPLDEYSAEARKQLLALPPPSTFYYTRVPLKVVDWLPVDSSERQWARDERVRDLTGSALATNDAKPGEKRATFAGDLLGDMFGTASALGDGGRVVAVLPTEDLNALSPEMEVAGLSWNPDVVMVRIGEPGQTAIHELIHTMPWAWSDAQMVNLCGQSYHNKSDGVANGVRMYNMGELSDRNEIDRLPPVMGPADSDLGVWVTQCTYYHLTQYLAPSSDPPMILIRGILDRSSGHVRATMLPAYERDAALALPSKGGTYAVDFFNAAGTRIGHYPFAPLFAIEEYNIPRDVITFRYSLPYSPRIATIVVRGPQGVLVQEQMSAHAPRLSAKLLGRTVTWNAQGEPGRTLYYTLLLSQDAGESWFPEFFETKQLSYIIPASRFGHNTRLRLLVTDGTRSAETTLAPRP